MSTLFVKFSFNQVIKKVQIHKDDLTWDNVCAILMKAFLLTEKSKIQLKYKDLEDDEITVNSDQDLLEAYHLYFVKNLIKFFVYYSGTFLHDSKCQSSGYSKLERSKSMQISGEWKESPSLCKISDQISSQAQKNQNQLLIDDKQTPSNSIDSEDRSVKVKVDAIELQNILGDIFSTPEVVKKVQEKLRPYVSQNEKEFQTYSIETDLQAITGYITKQLGKIINENVKVDTVTDKNQKDQAESSPIQQKEDRIRIQESQKLRDIKGSFKDRSSLLDVSLRESVYEFSPKNALCGSIKANDSRIISLNSSMECKNLASSLGVRLVLKYENGKAKLVSMPVSEYSMIESKSLNESKKYVDNKNRVIEKSNKTQKDQKGLEDSLYERID